MLSDIWCSNSLCTVSGATVQCKLVLVLVLLAILPDVYTESHGKSLKFSHLCKKKKTKTKQTVSRSNRRVSCSFQWRDYSNLPLALFVWITLRLWELKSYHVLAYSYSLNLVNICIWIVIKHANRTWYVFVIFLCDSRVPFTSIDCHICTFMPIHTYLYVSNLHCFDIHVSLWIRQMLLLVRIVETKAIEVKYER